MKAVKLTLLDLTHSDHAAVIDFVYPCCIGCWQQQV